MIATTAQAASLAVEVGDHETRVTPFGAVLDRGDDPSGAPPYACAVAELGEQPALSPGRLEAVPGDLARHLNLAFEHRVARQPHDVPNLVTVAPIEHPVPALEGARRPSHFSPLPRGRLRANVSCP